MSEQNNKNEGILKRIPNCKIIKKKKNQSKQTFQQIYYGNSK